MEMGKVNLIAFLLLIPISLVIVVPFLLIWGVDVLFNDYGFFHDYFIFILMGGIITHELLHGLTWGYFAPNGLKSIKYGVQWKYLTPYCHCTEPLKVTHYKIGAFMPLLILGIIPSVIALLTGSIQWIFFGMLFSCAAGGDIIALFMLRRLDGDSFVSDHPDKMGFIREN